MREIEILSTKAQTFLRTAERAMSDGDYDTRIVGDYGVNRSVAQDEAEDLLNAAQDFVGKVKEYLDRWAQQT